MVQQASQMGTLLCRLRRHQPHPHKCPQPGPCPAPATGQCSRRKALRECVQGLEPLSGSHCSPSVLKNFLGKWVSFTAWEMQPTVRGRTAPHMPTTVRTGLLI